MSNSRRSVLVSLLAVTALLTLAACAPATHDSLAGGQSTTTKSGSSGTPSPGSTAKPKPKSVAPPKVRVPLTCEQLAPAAQVSTALGAPETLNTTDQDKGNPWQPFDLEPYAYIQDGARVCNYSTANPSDLSFFRAYVMPDATAALWDPYFAQISAPSSFNITPSPFGAESNLNCQSMYHILSCELNILIGSTWVDLFGNSDEYPASTNAAAEAKFMPVFSTAVAAVKASTIAEPLWKDPAATSVGVSSDYAALDASLTTALGSPVQTQSYEYGPTVEEPTDDSVIPVHFGYYGDSVNNDVLNIQVLPQGSWAWSAILAAAASEPGYTAVSGLGDKAVSFSVTGGESPSEVAVVVIKGHNLFTVEVDTSDAASAPGVLGVAKQAATVVAAQIG